MQSWINLASPCVQKILYHFHAILSQEGFGVELDAFDGVTGMANPHNLQVIHGLRCYFKTGGEGTLFGNEGMVTRCSQRILHTPKEGFAVVLDHTSLAMHEHLGSHDSAAEYMDDALTAHADSERRNLRTQMLKDQGTGSKIPWILGSSWSR